MGARRLLRGGHQSLAIIHTKSEPLNPNTILPSLDPISDTEMTEEDEESSAVAEKKQDQENHNVDSVNALFPLPPPSGKISKITK